MAISSDDLATCLGVLKSLQQEPEQCTIPQSAAEEISKEASRLLRALKAQEKSERKRRDLDIVEASGIRQRREHKAQTAGHPNLLATETNLEATTNPALPALLSSERNCYVCKRLYRAVHDFYDWLCPECGDVNFAKRTQSADLTRDTALVTGGRIKIGFQIALKLLRAGARVLITTRFPHDAALRFSRETDFQNWQDRLSIHSADFRYLPHVQSLALSIADQVEHLEILINNAAQTVRRPAAFYKHLLENESKSLAELPKPAQGLIEDRTSTKLSEALRPSQWPGVLSPAAMSQLPLLPDDEAILPEEFPLGKLDADGQQVDRRAFNSWVQRLGDVSLGELVEVHAVNCLAPYILIGCLEPLMQKSPTPDRYIVNVSAMEGKFHAKKTGFHPHTNMAKAAMNMITRTCADRFARQQIFMNSVDTGWITNEFPFQKTQQMAENGFQPPLDEIDGAARVCDPIFCGRNSGLPVFGKFYKDYREVSW